MMSGMRSCEECGNDILTSNPKARFCSRKCGDTKWNREHRAQKTAQQKAYAEAHPEAVKKSHEDHLAKLAAQQGGDTRHPHYLRQIELHGRDAVILRNYKAKLKRIYNITLEKYEEMLAAQDGGCAICHITPEQHGQRLAVDHDHKCCPGKTSCGECVRGLLCKQCNQRVAFLELDGWSDKAVAYLQRDDVHAGALARELAR